MSGRLTCLCPGCRRTTAKPYVEWICEKHWAAVPRHLRKRRSKLSRLAKRDCRWERLANRAWSRCKKAAIEEALLGITV